MEHHHKRALLPIFLLLISMVSLQSGAALAKMLLPLFHAEGVTAIRIGAGMVLLCLFFRPWRHYKAWTLTPFNLAMLIGYGCTLGSMNLLFYKSLDRIPLGIAVALEFLGPLTLALFSSRAKRDVFWIILAVGGLYFLLPIRESVGHIDTIGVCYAIGAGIFWALYILFGKRAGAIFHTQAAAVGTSISALFILPIGIPYIDTALLSGPIMAMSLGVALLSTAIPYALEITIMPQLSTKTFGILMSLEPVVATLCGLVFLHETLTGSQTIALFCIIMASLGTTVSSAQKQSTDLNA